MDSSKNTILPCTRVHLWCVLDHCRCALWLASFQIRPEYGMRALILFSCRRCLTVVAESKWSNVDKVMCAVATAVVNLSWKCALWMVASWHLVILGHPGWLQFVLLFWSSDTASEWSFDDMHIWQLSPGQSVPDPRELEQLATSFNKCHASYAYWNLKFSHSSNPSSYAQELTSYTFITDQIHLDWQGY